jgi:hypothetical protein
MDTRLRTHIDALRTLAKSNDLNQVILVEQNIDEYLKARADHLSHALELFAGCCIRCRWWKRRHRINAMNEKTIDQIEEVLIYEISDEAVEAAGMRTEIAGVWTFICTGIQCGQVFALKQ